MQSWHLWLSNTFHSWHGQNTAHAFHQNKKAIYCITRSYKTVCITSCNACNLLICIGAILRVKCTVYTQLHFVTLCITSVLVLKKSKKVIQRRARTGLGLQRTLYECMNVWTIIRQYVWEKFCVPYAWNGRALIIWGLPIWKCLFHTNSAVIRTGIGFGSVLVCLKVIHRMLQTAKSNTEKTRIVYGGYAKAILYN